jgi:hypothetical protein
MTPLLADDPSIAARIGEPHRMGREFYILGTSRMGQTLRRSAERRCPSEEVLAGQAARRALGRFLTERMDRN